LSALGHTVGIVIDFRARTKAKRPRQLQKVSLIYQSLVCLATRAPGLYGERGTAASSIWRVGRGLYPDRWRRRLLTAEALFDSNARPAEFVTVEQVASLALFLCSDDAAQITGPTSP
jgi:hypothetical protein